MIADIVRTAATSAQAIAIAAAVVDAQRSLGGPPGDAYDEYAREATAAVEFRIEAFSRLLSSRPSAVAEGELAVEKARYDALASAAALRWRYSTLARGIDAWRAHLRAMRRRRESKWAVHAVQLHMAAHEAIAKGRAEFDLRLERLACRAAVRRWVRYCTVGVGLAFLRFSAGRRVPGDHEGPPLPRALQVERRGADGRLFSLALRATLRVWRRSGRLMFARWRQLVLATIYKLVRASAPAIMAAAPLASSGLAGRESVPAATWTATDAQHAGTALTFERSPPGARTTRGCAMGSAHLWSEVSRPEPVSPNPRPPVPAMSAPVAPASSSSSRRSLVLNRPDSLWPERHARQRALCSAAVRWRQLVRVRDTRIRELLAAELGWRARAAHTALMHWAWRTEEAHARTELAEECARAHALRRPLRVLVARTSARACSAEVAALVRERSARRALSAWSWRASALSARSEGSLEAAERARALALRARRRLCARALLRWLQLPALLVRTAEASGLGKCGRLTGALRAWSARASAQRLARWGLAFEARARALRQWAGAAFARSRRAREAARLEQAAGSAHAMTIRRRVLHKVAMAAARGARALLGRRARSGVAFRRLRVRAHDRCACEAVAFTGLLAAWRSSAARGVAALAYAAARRAAQRAAFLRVQLPRLRAACADHARVRQLALARGERARACARACAKRRALACWAAIQLERRLRGRASILGRPPAGREEVESTVASIRRFHQRRMLAAGRRSGEGAGLEAAGRGDWGALPVVVGTAW